MDHEHLSFVKADGVATLTFDRQRQLNAFTADMYEGMNQIIHEVETDEEVKVFVLTGTGRAFCVGADVKSLEQGFSARAVARTKAGDELLTVPLRRMGKPVIAAINGIAAGGGLDIACACDIRIASEKATFSSLFVRRGILPTMGGTYLLPRLIGIDRACQLIWTGDIIDAGEAERIGLVTKVVPHDELEAATEELAAKLVKGPPLAIARSKKVIYKGLNMEFEPALNDIMTEWAALTKTGDHQEALRAFLEKREPVFKGE